MIWSVVDESGVEADTLNYVVFGMSFVGRTFRTGNVTRISGDATNGTYEGTTVVPTTPSGSYYVHGYARDQFGNISQAIFSETFTVSGS